MAGNERKKIDQMEKKGGKILSMTMKSYKFG